MSPCSNRVNRVIPVTVEAMPFELNGRQLRIGDGDAARVRAAIQFGPHVQPGPAMGRSDQARDGGVEYGAIVTSTMEEYHGGRTMYKSKPL